MHQMGFPLSRAARACQLFGKDESKVCNKFSQLFIKLIYQYLLLFLGDRVFDPNTFH